MTKNKRLRKTANKTTNNQPPLPDTTKWQPRSDKTNTLQASFLKRCIAVEKKIVLRAQYERGMIIDNFDAGSGIEDILRDELREILPHRYTVTTGTIVDRKGNTAGDCDIIIFNDHWFPSVKPGAIPTSRKTFFPIDGAYAIIEVKQALDYEILDEAMKKLVICNRLERPHTNANRIVENNEFDGCFHGLRNPLYTAIIATSLKDGIDMDILVERFFNINTTLDRLEVIRCLCVLGQGSVTWFFRDLDGNIKPTLFMREDLFTHILPAYHKVPQTESALYACVSDLLLHLYQSVLAAEDIAIAYGPVNYHFLGPTSPMISLSPDPEWMEKLNWTRNEQGQIKLIDEQQ
ncbi:DUF6602 domain-containing protein [Herpetosiphon llansteffanensis]|uniref:DUF6602 domain-containing protein n=1 Tax=Herpetosiphon llansteffanensis TaxID=2094568 RepID=UPI000D7CD612|nr:DUF6602 domain-containing protein [Herpetosiphon llansteffanensis]